MSRSEQEEDATRKVLDSYSKLVAMSAQEIANGNTGKWLRETVAGMTERQAKAMLIARAAAEAVEANEILERLGDPEEQAEAFDQTVLDEED